MLVHSHLEHHHFLREHFLPVPTHHAQQNHDSLTFFLSHLPAFMDASAAAVCLQGIEKKLSMLSAKKLTHIGKPRCTLPGFTSNQTSSMGQAMTRFTYCALQKKYHERQSDLPCKGHEESTSLLCCTDGICCRRAAKKWETQGEHYAKNTLAATSPGWPQGRTPRVLEKQPTNAVLMNSVSCRGITDTAGLIIR